MDPRTEPVEAEPSPGAFGCQYRSTGDRIVVAVEGEIDLATAPALLATLRDALASPASAVVADLTGVEFIDSSGVHALLVAEAAAGQHGSRFIVRGAQPAVSLVFDILGLTDHLTREPNAALGAARQHNGATEAADGAPKQRSEPDREPPPPAVNPFMPSEHP